MIFIWDYLEVLSLVHRNKRTTSAFLCIKKASQNLSEKLPSSRLSPNYLFKYSSIPLAAALPAPIAKITVAAPVTASPPA